MWTFLVSIFDIKGIILFKKFLYYQFNFPFQAQFNSYVIKLRGEYSTKVATFRHVLESHQSDFKQKQDFYEKAIKVGESLQ